jgi:hypothetical protein
MVCSKTASLLLWAVAWPAAGQPWVAVRLHPSSALDSEIKALGPGVQGGTVRVQIGGLNSTLPALWHGSAASWAHLAYQQGLASDLTGIWGDTQVGNLSGQAALWHGTPASHLNLRPGQLSEVRATRGDMQVGYAFYTNTNPGHERAALWRGTAESYVDLHPAGALRSSAYATDGVLQGGEAEVPYRHAALWTGTAASFTDLGGGRISTIRGMAPGTQVGWVDLPMVGFHAAVWHGSAESFQDFNGPMLASQFLATTGSIHVGDGGTAPFARAVINFGTPDAWLELHQFLPPGYNSYSGANAVYQDGPTIYVGGYATPDGSFAKHAFLWIGTLPCYANCDGSTTIPALNVADFSCFLQHFAAGDGYANCDRSTTPPTLSVADFTCFLQRFAAGCP